jgi:hypothetical protein
MIIWYPEPFLFPSVIFDEMEKHKGELLRKSKMRVKEFEALLETTARKRIYTTFLYMLHFKR